MGYFVNRAIRLRSPGYFTRAQEMDIASADFTKNTPSDTPSKIKNHHLKAITCLLIKEMPVSEKRTEKELERLLLSAPPDLKT